MDKTYYYSGPRVKALQTTLLNETNLERLLSAKSTDEVYVVLHDTFFAPFVAEAEVKKKSLFAALREALVETKKELLSLAPEPALLDLLWIRYDFFNAKVALKGKRAGISRKEVRSYCYPLGTVAIEKVLENVFEEKQAAVPSFLRRALEQAEKEEQSFAIDLSLQKAYFQELSSRARKTAHPFLQKYAAISIDIFNMKTRLRLLRLQDLGLFPSSYFIEGGTFRPQDMEKEEQVLALLGRFGGKERWEEAIQEYREEGHMTIMEKVFEDILLDFVKEEEADIFSLAPLYGYFLARRNNAMIIKTIYRAKESGMEEAKLRRILRRLYV